MYLLPSFNSYQLKASIFFIYIPPSTLPKFFETNPRHIILLIKFSLYIFKWLKNNHNTVIPWNTHSYSLVSLDIQSVFTYPQMFNWFVLQKLFILYLEEHLDLSKVSVFQWLCQLPSFICSFPFPAHSLSLSFLGIYLKKLGHLFYRVFQSLDFTGYIPVVFLTYSSALYASW